MKTMKVVKFDTIKSKEQGIVLNGLDCKDFWKSKIVIVTNVTE